MPPVRVIKIGKVPVPSGLPADLVGTFTHHLCEGGIDPDRFMPKDTDPSPWNNRQGIVAWSTKTVETVKMELCLINFGEDPRDFKAVYDRIRQEGYPVTDFPELCAIKGRAGELWDMGVPCAAATSPDSLMRRDDGDLSVPYLYCVPGYCNLSTRWVGFRWRREFAWFLVGAK